MKLPIFPIILVVVIAVVGGVAYWKMNTPSAVPGMDTQYESGLDADGDRDGDSAKAPEQAAPSAPQPTVTQPAPTPSGYTMADVSAHASAQSCWTVISGNVYDLTSWIAQHPGGKNAILRLCGKDGTASFNAQHGGQGSAERELANFKLGPLN